MSSTAIHVSELTHDFGGLRAVDNISFTINEGELVGLIGPNGCGKSTFIKVIFGIANLYQGDIIYRNEDITGMRADSLVKKGIGYVPQTDNVFPSLTVEENLRVGLSGSLKRKLVPDEVLDLFPVLRQM